jgi:hypothetical protein
MEHSGEWSLLVPAFESVPAGCGDLSLQGDEKKFIITTGWGFSSSL